jgi:hypothetical protein
MKKVKVSEHINTFSSINLIHQESLGTRLTSSQKRELLRERRAGKPNQDRIWELKKLWEKLRPQGSSKSEQIELVGKILAIINGDFAEVPIIITTLNVY